MLHLLHQFRQLGAEARGGSLLLAFQIGSRGSRRQHPLPDRPPTLQAFRSVHSKARPVSTHGFHGSRSCLRRHGVQFRRAHIWYHKTASAVYQKTAANPTREKLPPDLYKCGGCWLLSTSKEKGGGQRIGRFGKSVKSIFIAHDNSRSRQDAYVPQE